MEISFTKSNLFEEAILEISKLIKGTKFENHVYLVGGCVRDKILGKEIHNIDLVVNYPNGGFEFAKWICKETDCYKDNFNPLIFPTSSRAKFKIYSISRISDIEIECCQTNNGKPCGQSVESQETSFGTLLQDAVRRDLTINALYINLSNFIVLDPTQKGLHDIKNCIIRTPSNFNEDPIRTLRAIKFATMLGWGIEGCTWANIVRNVPKLSTVSFAEIVKELTEILLSDKPSIGVDRLWHSGVLRLLLKDVYDTIKIDQNFETVFEHTKKVLDACPRTKTVRWAALLHDIGKPSTKTSIGFGIKFTNHENVGCEMAKTLLSVLKFTEKEKDDITTLIKYHTCFKPYYNKAPNTKSMRVILKKVGVDHIYNLLTLVDANNKASGDTNYEMQVSKILKVVNSILKEEKSSPKEKITLPLTGNDIMERFKIKSGPSVGKLLKQLNTAYLSNPKMTKEEAFKYVEEKLCY